MKFHKLLINKKKIELKQLRLLYKNNFNNALAIIQDISSGKLDAAALPYATAVYLSHLFIINKLCLYLGDLNKFVHSFI